MRIPVFALLASALACCPAAAQSSGALPPTTTDAGPRFDMRPEGGGYVRLDRRTGAMSFCAVSNGNLVCRLGADEREAYQKSLDEMASRLDELEDRVEDLAAAKPESEPVRPRREPPAATGPDPAEEELERAVDFAERAMRRFFDVVKQLRAELEREQQAR